MGIFKTMVSFFKRDEKEKTILDHDRDGNPLYKDEILSFVNRELEKRKNDRQFLENQWRLNANFLVGNQYCEFNQYSGEIKQLDPPFDWQERGIYNVIAPLIETRIANLKKINFRMKTKPNTTDLDDYKKAETSTSLLQYLQVTSDFDTKKNSAIYWNELCGDVFWLSWWDPSKGELYAIEKEINFDASGKMAVTEIPYYEGDLDYGLVTSYEVFPENLFKQGVESQRSIIIEQVKTVDEIYDLYGINVKGTTVDTFNITPVKGMLGYGYEGATMGIGTCSVDDSERVITYFERPSKRYASGRLIIVIGNELIYYGDLPYSRIPIVQMQCYEVPGHFFGRSAVENLIPLQREYNSCINRIHEYIKRIAINQFMVEEDAIDIEEYEEEGGAPGYIIKYRTGMNPPIPVSNASLPAEVMNERITLKNEMEYTAGVSQLMVSGNAPQTNMSGTAISNLMEIDNTRLSLTGDHLRTAVKNLSVLWLEIYKKYVKTKRVINCVGKNNIGSALVWSADDINSYDVEYTTENELVMSEDMQRQKFIDSYNMGLFTDENGVIPERVKLYGIEYMKFGNYSEILNLNLLQMQSAQRENAFFDKGVIPEVSEFDEHSIHIEEHKRYMLQMDFYVLKNKKKEYAESFEEHIKEHQRYIDEEKKQMMAEAMVSLNAQH